MAIPIVNLSSLDGIDGFRLDGETQYDFSGLVSTAGDVNGDGFDDVIIGAFGSDQNALGSGSSYVVFGNAGGFNASMNLSDLDGNNGFRLDGEGINHLLGTSISNAGDVNGDGFDDVIVSAPGADSNGYDSGSSYVVFGKESGFGAVINLSSLNGTNGFRLDGAAKYDEAGFLVSNAGDVNGDGFDDVIVSAPRADSNGYDSGSSYVVFGKESGFSAAMNLSSIDGNNGFRLDGNAYDYVGLSVSTAGDVNGDGLDDVIVGVYKADLNGAGSGSSYVVFGKESGFSAVMDLSSIDGTNGFRLDGTTHDSAGLPVSTAGDINGDGFDDVIVGAWSAETDGNLLGSNYIVFGKASGFDAAMDLSSLDGNNGFRLNENNNFGSISSVSNAGDVNGDGIDDFIVGVSGAEPNGHWSGSSYVVFGKTSGFNASMALSNLSSIDGFRLDGAEDDLSGGSVSSAGDVNRDGFDDLIIGANGADPNGERSGSSYIVFGRSDFGDGGFPVVGTPENDQLEGTSAAEHFKAGDGNDRMIGRGGADEFHGEAGNDYIQVLDLGFGLVDGGSGNDVLHTDGKDLNLDLTGYRGKIRGIETIDLSGQGDNMLTLTEAELKELSDTTDTLKVHGNAGDQVILEGNWIDGGGEGTYHTYMQGDAVALVESGILVMPKTIINLSSLDGSNGFRLDGSAAVDESGRSVSKAGDINGDGFDDVIVGAPGASGIYDLSSGSAFVVFGAAAGFEASLDLSLLDGKNGFRVDGEDEFNWLGNSVSSAGDVNGDGFDDVILGANTDLNGYSSGSSYVLFGKASGFDATLSLPSLDGGNGFRLDGEAGDYANTVSDAGDVNGDGFGDLIIGAVGASSNGVRSGSTYVVFGRASGFDAKLNLSNLDGHNGFRLDGELTDGSNSYNGDYSGESVSNAGDVNGDGFDDVIIGASGADPNGDNSGNSYVVFGKASGFSAEMDLANLDGKNGFRLDGASAGDSSGKSVSSAGDVNGDGFDDVVIGTFGGDSNDEHSHSSYVVFGRASGFSAAMDLAGLDGSNGFRLDGEVETDWAGRSVSTAGDVNGDGFDDVIVGTPNAYTGGSSYVVFGKASGFSDVVDLTNLDSDSGFRIDGESGIDMSSSSVSTAGDINGDGLDDLIVGASHADWNDFQSGSSYIIFGRKNSGSVNVIEGTSEDDQLKGTSAAEHFKAGDGNDRMIGRGGADEFYGEAGNDYIQVTDLGFGLVDGGAGNDVLHTDGKELDLDLTDYPEKIQGIETICLYGRGDNTLTLTGAELKQLSDTTNTLKVHGNAGDQVILEGNWIDGGSHGFYHTYTQDDAMLLVGMNMTAVFV
ncbi:hypothetical protein ABF87_05990 [Nitrosomonas sp. JL21]|uniref:beta strand repeat-containing protein n=1 Tax=Nitrosomonas sp. JL21 TaxID=153949 RepID=UPI0013706359|nr:integrin alpha [Nitrosomonas sp. JL21]MXS77519.1 hypothetical protein [Nitrosomonas sp. JL21]